MKLIKINTDHYVVVDDSEIKEGDWTYHHVKGIYKARVDGAYTNQKKITYSTQPLEIIKGIGENSSINYYYGTDQLSIQEVEELIGEVDVENKAELYVFWSGVYLTEQEKQQTEIAYMTGYNQALEDNKGKKYTEEDVRKAYDDGYSVRDAHGDRSDNMTSDEYVKSLQPKTEWEVEIVDGKLKLKL